MYPLLQQLRVIVKALRHDHPVCNWFGFHRELPHVRAGLGHQFGKGGCVGQAHEQAFGVGYQSKDASIAEQRGPTKHLALMHIRQNGRLVEQIEQSVEGRLIGFDSH